MKCLLVAANKVVKTGRIRVGWTVARVEALAQRPLQCYRCLQKGHVRRRCPNPEDPSGNCYRCEDPGPGMRGRAEMPELLRGRASDRPQGGKCGVHCAAKEEGGNQSCGWGLKTGGGACPAICPSLHLKRQPPKGRKKWR